jgi:DNA-binding PadR family transcriptional regulator
MRQILKKMETSRRRNKFRNTEKEMELVERRRTKMRACEATPESTQNRVKPMTVVGSDVEALYPSLDDLEVAEICFNEWRHNGDGGQI